MKKVFSIFLAVLMVISILPISAFAQANYYNISIDVTYGQTEARTMLSMINELREPENAWYWNSSDTSKVYPDNLQNLVYDYELEKVAMQRAAELAVYYSHTRPNGSVCFSAFSGTYSSAGENIAYGYNTAEEVFEAWSEENENYEGQGHRRNMLNETFTAVAVGHVIYEGVHYWVQEFCSPTSSTEYTAPCDKTETIAIEMDLSYFSYELNFDSSPIYVEVGESVIPTVYFKINGISVDCDEIILSISDSSVAEVKNGKVIGLSVGKTSITASLNDVSTTISLVVIEPYSYVPLCMHTNTINVEKTNPTCLERGFAAGVYCNDCNTYISGHETIPCTNNHSVQQKTTASYTYYQCEVCEKYFSDKSGKTEVSAAKVESEIVKLTSTVVDSGNLYYEDNTWTFYSDGTLILEGYGNMTFGSNVYSTPQYDAYSDNIKKVIICDGFDSIGYYAFFSYPALETAVLGNTITKINCAAFANCSKLSKINFPTSLRVISGPWSDSAGVFEGCYNLKNVHLNEGCTTLGDYAFFESGIENIYLPDSLKIIGNGLDGYTFANCANLTAIFIPESVKFINTFSFYDCIQLSKITFEDSSSLEYLEQNVFNGTAYFNDSSNWKNDILYIDTILVQAGKERDTLNGSYFYPEDNYFVPVPDGVTMLAELAFWRCDSVKYISLPESLKYICTGAFYKCLDLVEIYIPSNVESIGEDAFYGCEALKNVTFADNSVVQSIGSSAFDGCCALEKINLPNGLTKISNSIFRDCSSLKEITIPESVEIIDSGAFYNCVSLGEIYILNSDVDISSAVFYNTLWYNNHPDGLIYWNNTCLGWKGDNVPKEIKIAEGTKKIVTGAFWGDNEVEKVILPDSVTTIGDNAFSDCVGLKEIILSKNLISMGIYAFYNCSQLEKIELPENLEIIGKYAFMNCTELTQLVFPEKMSIIGDMAFYGCTKLVDITFSDSITEIGGAAFAMTEWSRNQKQDIYIGNIFYLFDGFSVSAFTNNNFMFKDGTTMIAGDSLCGAYDYSSGTFFGLSNAEDIKKVLIPNSVNKIGASAFSVCSQLQDVYYTGSETDWEKIVIEDGNEYLRNAAIHYNHVHNYSSDTITNASCIDDIEYMLNCTECGASDYVTIPATGHNYVTVITAPTCTEQGFTTYTCSCGDSYTDDYVDATGHDYATVITAPTCTEYGFTTYTCSCGDSYTGDYVDAMGHDYATVITAPTCTEYGFTTYTCSCGDSYTDDYVDATGHDYATIVTAPTTTSQGYTTCICSVCGDSYITDYVDAFPEETTEPTTETIVVLGDVNGDENITATDARLALRISAKLETPTEEQLKAADVNGDGIVSASDARIILRVSAKLETF